MASTIYDGKMAFQIGKEENNAPYIKTYKRRLWMLALFSTTSFLCGMLYPLYASMSDMNKGYYGVSWEAINWTGMLFMVVYLVFFFPASMLIEYIDLRWTVALSSLCNTIACCVQFAGVGQNAFVFVMISVSFASLSNLFVLGVPLFLAARWFPTNELSRACAFGVFGNQLGVAVGFLFPAFFIPSDYTTKTKEIESAKFRVATILTAVNTVVLLLILFTFQNCPPKPPSLAQMQKPDEIEKKSSHFKTVMRFFTNPNFVMVFVIYGIVVGTYFALITTLSEMVSNYFKNHDEGIGIMGFLLIVAGLLGSVIAGYILDRTHKFKETSLAICALTLIFHAIFSGMLFVNIFWIQYITISLYGFFLTSFLSVGFEYGVEVTYPESESVCGCLMNTATMLFGIILTQIDARLLEAVSPVATNVALGIGLLIACILTSFVTTDYKRSKKNVDINP